MNRHISQAGFTIQEVDWETAGPKLSSIRKRVFIEEQQVPVELEWDGLDENAIHLLAFDTAGRPAGCARILDGGSIGRMAVVRESRGQGAGKILLAEAIAYCRKRGWPAATLSAQTHAIPFYQRMGFVVCSEEYMDAGIPHRDMRLELSN